MGDNAEEKAERTFERRVMKVLFVLAVLGFVAFVAVRSCDQLEAIRRLGG